jgi:hypothetical protein
VVLPCRWEALHIACTTINLSYVRLMPCKPVVAKLGELETTVTLSLSLESRNNDGEPRRGGTEAASLRETIHAMARLQMKACR